ncbi:MAG: esterase [Glaciihabitans sp.]|nr:esterase [Glaciihabitans sp.]
MSNGASTPWLTRAPLANRLFAGGIATGASSEPTDDGLLWSVSGTGPGESPFVVVFANEPERLRWLPSSIAVGLGAAVLTVDAGIGLEPDLLRILDNAAARGIDTSRLGIIGEGNAAQTAINAATRMNTATAARTGTVRLALVSPGDITSSEPTALPPTLLQFSRASGAIDAITSVERALRANGVAARATDYTDLADGWQRFPKAVRGSRRGLEDLVAFLNRGLGEQSTFHVIPGWDLH